jgi:thiol-disulfide isomerase/thioredoxin
LKGQLGIVGFIERKTIPVKKIQLFIGLFLLYCTSLAGQTVKVPLQVVPASPFILPAVDGQVLKSSSLKGKVVLLEFFQTWCPDCKKAAPQMEALYQKYKDQGFVAVGVSHDQLSLPDASARAKVVEPFVKNYNITYPILLGDYSIGMNYIQKPSFHIPYLVFIDRKGNIVGRYEEGKDKEATDFVFIENQIKQLLAEPR